MARVLFDTTKSNIFLPEGKKIRMFGIFKGNIPNPNLNQRWLTRPDVTKNWPDPGQTLTFMLFKRNNLMDHEMQKE